MMIVRLLGGPPVLCCDEAYREDLRPIFNLLFRRLWHSFTSRTFKAEDEPAYQHRRFFKLRDSSRQMNNVTAPTAP